MKKTKTIGMGIEKPKEKCDDQYCPFHSNLKLRGQNFVGTVISSKMQKSAVVQWVTRHYLPKYERYIHKRSKISVHNPPCINAVEGDEVKIVQCRPLSKTKNFVIVQKLGKSKDFIAKEKLYEVEERKEMERKRNREAHRDKGDEE